MPFTVSEGWCPQGFPSPFKLPNCISCCQQASPIRLHDASAGIKRLRIMFLNFTHFSSDNMMTVSNDDIVVSTLLLFLYTILKQSQRAWKEWHKSSFHRTFWIGRNNLDAWSQWSLQGPICWISSSCCICPLGNPVDRKPICKGFQWLWLPCMKYIASVYLYISAGFTL